MNSFPALYFYLNIFFSGIALFAILQFTYTFFKIRRKEVLFPTLFSCVAFIYIISDISAIVFLHIVPKKDMANLFIMLHVLSPLFFIIVGQYFINQILPLKASLKKINTLILWASVAAIAIMVSMTIINPDLLIRGAGSSGYSLKLIHGTQDMGPLFIIRDILLGIYIIYCIITILFFGFQKYDPFPTRYTLAGLILVGYSFSSYLYSLFFAPAEEPGIISYDFLGISVIIFLVLMTFERIKIIVKYVAQLTAVKKDLGRILYNDSALNIPNRLAYLRDLQDELIKIEVENNNLFLLFFDLDDFQDFNDCYGEHTGDSILKMLTERLTDLFAQEGNIYRIGGDEFAFLLKDAESEDEAKNFAGRIIACLRNPFLIEEIPYLVSASIGVLQIPRDGHNTEAVLNNAYNVIRCAKKTKNTFEVFTQELRDNTSKKIHIVNILRNSIDRDEFTLFYQPIINKDKKISHSEALLRFTGNDPHINGPGVFIPILEDAGLIKEIDNMVIRKSFNDLEMKIKNSFSVSINLSTNQLVDPAYSDFLASFATQHGIEKSRIVLEVTENKLMDNLSAGRENITKLKNCGFTIAIDDFGKGFSSLTYLSELPVDILKMDMVFVQSVPGDSKKETLSRHIIDLAHSLGLKVIAEGIEQQEQFDFLNSIGCDLFQGYYFARPMPLDELLSKYF